MQLDACQLNYAYIPGKTVLHDVSLSVKSGELLFILGKNGGGKTTLLACLAGLLKPTQGKVMFNGSSVYDFSVMKRAQLIGMIPQMHVPTFAYSVEEMVLMGRAPHMNWLGAPSELDKQIVEESLEQVGISELRDRPYTEISGGERQLVLIARGLAQKCQILLMDEPTAHLDLSNQHRVMDIIRQLTLQGLSFILSSHAPNDALSYADRALLLNDGWVLDYGQPRDILTEAMISSVYGVQTDVIYSNQDGLEVPRAFVPRLMSRVTPDSVFEPGNLLFEVFEKKEVSPQLILVTGLSGAGKTTWCKQLAKLAGNQGLTIGGILSPGIYRDGKKIGIGVLDLKSGETRQLASLREKDKSSLSTPRWSFYPEVVAWADQILKDLSPRVDLLIIDELGPLEFLRNEGLISGLELIDKKDYKIACAVVRSSLLPKALQRWPDAYVVNGTL